MSAISGLSVKQRKQQALALLQAGRIAEAGQIYEGPWEMTTLLRVMS